MALTAGDVTTIRAIRTLSDTSERDAAYRAKLAALEAELSSAGKKAYTMWTRDRMSAELRRWRPAYRIEATQAGYRVLRWIGRRREYAKRATAARLGEAELAPYRALIRC